MTIQELYYARKYLVEQLKEEKNSRRMKYLSECLSDVDELIEGIIKYATKKPEVNKITTSY